MTNSINYIMTTNPHNTLREEGLRQGLKTKKHPDQEIQEEWDKKVLKNKMSYKDFHLWLDGYKEARTTNKY